MYRITSQCDLDLLEHSYRCLLTGT